MNILLKTKLINVLKAEARQILDSDEEMSSKVNKMNDIGHLLKIIQNYDELEPVLAKYFAEKHNKEKWEGR
ncbi:MAG: hypothetical protein IKF38_04930 [Clostridia bacterium]|nr:hypothetical protein [Clostridia bacterium]